jgi:ParB-like chromosome segregation protein Spo0J
MNKIPVDHINLRDRRFCITYPLDDAALYASVQKIGIIQPVILLNTSPFIVVTGFKRLVIARQLGLEEIPYCSVDISERDALLCAIHDNIQRGLNLIEKAHALERMLHLGFSSEEISDTSMILGLRAHEKILKTLIALASAEDSLKRFVVTRNLPMKVVDYLMRFEVSERSTIIHLLSPIHLTESTIREILEILSLLKIKQDRLPLERLNPASGQELVKQLKEMAHPILTMLHEKLQAIRQASALPPNIDIKVDPFFEKEYIDIGIRAKNEDDIYRAIEKLHRLADDGIMGSIFDLTKGDFR